MLAPARPPASAEFFPPRLQQMSCPPSAAAHAACFAFFRFFDIAKVFPANRLEKIPGAFGVMLDDVAAGIYAGAAAVGLTFFFPL